MSRHELKGEIKTVPIEKINILNPRVRNKKIFETITDNIANVGLKRPITVTPCKSGAAGKEYDLVCGQGRLEAFVACGQTHIPAMVIDASEEQALLMSLVENLARRQRRAIDQLQAIEVLQKQGYSTAEISQKTGLTDSYVFGMLKLLKQGEERLLAAVEAGHIPLGVAMQIAETPDEKLQKVLHDAYETKQLRGQRLITARRLIENRKLRGKAFMKRSGKNRSKSVAKDITVQDVMRVYRKDNDLKRHMTRKAEKVNNFLIFIVTALQTLLKEEHFNVLLKAEKIDSLPKQIATLMDPKGRIHG